MNDDELRHWQEVDHHLSELTKTVGWGVLVEYAHIYLMNPAKNRILNPPPAYEWNKYLSDANWVAGITDLLEAHKVVSKKVSDEIGRRREFIDDALDS